MIATFAAAFLVGKLVPVFGWTWWWSSISIDPVKPIFARELIQLNKAMVLEFEDLDGKRRRRKKSLTEARRERDG